MLAENAEQSHAQNPCIEPVADYNCVLTLSHSDSDHTPTQDNCISSEAWQCLHKYCSKDRVVIVPSKNLRAILINQLPAPQLGENTPREFQLHVRVMLLQNKQTKTIQSLVKIAPPQETHYNQRHAETREKDELHAI